MKNKAFVSGLIIFGFIFLLGSVRYIVYPAFIGSPDNVHIIVTRIQSSARTVIFNQTFSSQASIIYKQLVGGVPISSRTPPSCPAASDQWPYYHYELDFSKMGIRTSTAMSDAQGCQTIALVYLDGSIDHFSWVASDGTSFWVKLHQMVNAPEPFA
jgi:hypothetical protein